MLGRLAGKLLKDETFQLNDTLPKTHSLLRKMVVGKLLSFGFRPIFRVYVNFRDRNVYRSATIELHSRAASCNEWYKFRVLEAWGTEYEKTQPRGVFM